MSILDLQRIEGPFHQLKTAADCVVTLGQLQAAPQSMVAPGAAHRQHVRMQVRMAGTRAGNGKRKTDKFLTVKGADDLPADLLPDDEKTQRHQVHVIKVPNFLLQRDARSEFFY